MKQWTAPADGWWPALNPTGDYLAAGNQRNWLAKLTDEPITPRSLGEVDAQVLGFVSDYMLYRSERDDAGLPTLFAIDVRTGAREVAFRGPQAFGNRGIASRGHWGTWVPGAGYCIDGHPYQPVYPATGLGLSGEWITYQHTGREQPVVENIRTKEAHIIPIDGVYSARVVELSSGGYWMGYAAGAVWVRLPTGQLVKANLSGAPFGEGYGTLVERDGVVWVWTYNGDALDQPYAIGRPLGESEALWVPGIVGPDEQFGVGQGPDGFTLVGSTAGKLTAAVGVPYTSPRVTWLAMMREPAPRPSGAMLTRGVALDRLTDVIHKAKAHVNETWVQFDSNPRIGVADGTRPIPVCYGIQLAVAPELGRRAIVGCSAQADEAFFVDDRGYTVVFPGFGGGGWQAIRSTGLGFEVVFQQPVNADAGISAFVVFDPYAPGAPLRVFEGPMDSLGIFEFTGPTSVVMAHQLPSEVVNGVKFWQLVRKGGYAMGQVVGGELGTMGLVRPDGSVQMAALTYDEGGHVVGWNGYTNLPTRFEVNRRGHIWPAYPGQDTPEPDEARFVPYDPLPRHRLPKGAQKPMFYSPGPWAWSTHIEGGYWAYDLWQAGMPAPILFHDTREDFDDPIEEPVEQPNGEKAWRPIIHDGQPISVKRLAELTGALIACYHDSNDEHSHPRLEEMKRLRDEGYAIQSWRQFYPRLHPRTGEALDPLENRWCLEQAIRADGAEFDIVIVRAGWRGNLMPQTGQLAYPEPTLAMLSLYAMDLGHAYGRVIGHVLFGLERNDVSAWCVDQFTLERFGTPVPSTPLPRTVVRRETPAPEPLPGPEEPTPVPVPVPAPGPSKGGGKKKRIAIGAAIAGAVAFLIFWKKRRKPLADRVEAAYAAVKPDSALDVVHTSPGTMRLVMAIKELRTHAADIEAIHEGLYGRKP